MPPVSVDAPSDVPQMFRLVRLQSASDPESLRELRRKIASALAQTGLNDDDALAMEVAAGEILSNVHRHAYPGGIGPVFVEVFRTHATAGVIVMDYGRATEVIAVPSRQPSRRRYGGRGLYLAGRLSDVVDIRVNAVGHGLVVLLLKFIGRNKSQAA